MKNLIYLFALLGILLVLPADSQDLNTDKAGTDGQALIVSSSPDLAGLISEWVVDYELLGHGEAVDFVPLQASKERARLLFASDASMDEVPGTQAGKMLIGRDIIVPITSARNPMLEGLRTQGLTKEEISEMLRATGTCSWATFMDSNGNPPIHYYYDPDASSTKMVRNYLQTGAPGQDWIRVANSEELLHRIANDPYGIGFASLTSIADKSFSAFVPGIVPLPIDKNGNGKIDYFEEIYESPASLSRGAWVGKYPHELVNGLYALFFDTPLGQPERSFVKWILAEGQSMLPAVGYADLLGTERRAKIDMLGEPVTVAVTEQGSYSAGRTVIMVFIVLLILGLVVESFILYFRNMKAENALKNIKEVKPFSTSSLHIPKGLFFDKTHTWAYMEQNGQVKMGIDDFLPHVTGNFTGLKMKKAGQKVSKGELILTLVQKGKQLDIKSPVSGTITEQNVDLLGDVSLINTSPYHNGWVYRIEPSNWLREIQFMFMADKFRTWLGLEFNRLKDFLAGIQASDKAQLKPVVLQEGGELQDGILGELGPEAWDDFQEKFMDTTA